MSDAPFDPRELERLAAAQSRSDSSVLVETKAGGTFFINKAVIALGQFFTRKLETLGGISIFFVETLYWMIIKQTKRESLLNSFYTIGVLSLPVVMLTGMFIGMVLAVQTYTQFKAIGMETRIGAVINLSLLRELGPVLAATMLAGRVGSSIAAELGTMRVTEQIDALTSMGANPVHYLVVPRFIACLLLIPALTAMGDFSGVVGGALYCTRVLAIEEH
ncbi:MAG: MlaE family ABC transporter permease, partial [Thermoguttaceae bacterium]